MSFLNVAIHARCHDLLLKEEAIIQFCYRNCCILLGSKIECRGLTHWGLQRTSFTSQLSESEEPRSVDADKVSVSTICNISVAEE